MFNLQLKERTLTSKEVIDFSNMFTAVLLPPRLPGRNHFHYLFRRLPNASRKISICDDTSAPQPLTCHFFRHAYVTTLVVSEDEHVAVGRMDGSDARGRDRVRVRPPPQHVTAVQLEGARTQPEDHAGLRQVRGHGVSTDRRRPLATVEETLETEAR